MARKQHPAHSGPGILGVFRSDPEIVGVFPELSATAIPHAQEIRIRRGDSLTLPVQVQTDADPPDPKPIDGAVLRWAAKIGFGKTERDGVTVGNEGALILKRSYDASEIALTGGVGRAEVYVLREDTLDLPFSPAVWDLELTVPADPVTIPATGTIQFLEGSAIVLATGLDWESLGLRAGDLFSAQGRTVLVKSVISPAHLELDFDAWTTQTAPSSALSISRSQTKTVASGPFVVEGDVVI